MTNKEIIAEFEQYIDDVKAAKLFSNSRIVDNIVKDVEAMKELVIRTLNQKDKEKLFIINSVPCETIFEIPEDMNPVTLRGRDGVTAESIAGVRCGYQQKTKEIWDWKKQQLESCKKEFTFGDSRQP